MSHRLDELRRQHAIIEDHLAWLEGEIKALEKVEGAATLKPPAAATTPNPALIVGASRVVVPATPERTASAPVASVAAPAADAILDEYRVEPGALKSDIRKGCFLYFAGAFALLGLIVAALYFALSKR